MHDPMTVAFEIREFWRKPNQWGYKPSLITIWHVDPEKDGTDDSCDWFGRKLNAKEKALAERLIENEVDNLRSFFSIWIPAPDTHTHTAKCAEEGCTESRSVETCDHRDMRYRVECIFSCYKRNMHWRYPVRWHFWHWRFQIHPLQQFKRWAFSRCKKCGGRFTWGYSPVTTQWNGGGPRWFRNEANVYHEQCFGSGVSTKPQTSATV